MLIAPVVKAVALALTVAVADRALIPPHVPEAKERYNPSRLGKMGLEMLLGGHRV